MWQFVGVCELVSEILQNSANMAYNLSSGIPSIREFKDKLIVGK